MNGKRNSKERAYPLRFDTIEQRNNFKLYAIGSGKSMNELIHIALKRTYPKIFKLQ